MNKKNTILWLMPLLLTVACSTKTADTKVQAFDYDLPAEEYKTRLTASDPAGWKPVADKVAVPTEGVTLAANGVFKTVMEKNVDYLLRSFSVDHMLVPFRLRAGQPNPPDDRPQVKFWDTDLRGSNAGRFMMGAGNTLRWIKNAELQSRLDELIDGIEACREPNGYILAYPPYVDSLRSEEPNYARAWFTHGLIDAAISGNPKAYGLLRRHADWFNRWDEIHPKLLYWNHNSHQGHIAGTRTYLSPVGKPEDLQVAEKYYVCDWWMDELAARHEDAVWKYPLQNPHSYLITSFEAYLDHYRATGDKKFLEAMLGAWELIHDKWEHVGGSIAICESQWFVEDGKRVLKHWDAQHTSSHPPCSYYLGEHGHTGETCGSVFWAKFNQRFHQLFPDEEKYVAEIEKSVYNVFLSNQTSEGNIRYHTIMEGKKEFPRRADNSCCEGQGTRIFGTLPEYIFSIASDGLYVNLYEPSSILCTLNGKPAGLTIESDFPYKPEVSVKIKTASPERMKLRIRVPSWATGEMPLYVNGEKFTTGKPGTYVTLSRKWADGDEIRFTLPMGFRLTRYTGEDQIEGSERYAVEYGPLLMAVVGSENVPAHVKFDPSSPQDDLAGSSESLQFNIAGDSARFIPYWQVTEEQRFTTFPVLDK
jgi:DUF1680 family protein